MKGLLDQINQLIPFLLLCSLNINVRNIFCSFHSLLFYFEWRKKTHEFNSTLNETSQWIFYEKVPPLLLLLLPSFPFSFFSWKYSLPLFILLFFLSFILFNPLVDKFVYISLYAKDKEKKKIDNKIIVFFSMVNQPKNVFSIKVLCSYGIPPLSHGLVHLYLLLKNKKK